MVQKVPPPPTLPVQYQQLNRWLIELQSILNEQGTIDPSQIVGLPALFTQVATNTANITTINGEIAVIDGDITNINTEISVLQGQVTTLNTEVAALTARNQILNGSGAPGAGLGSNGDLYLNNTGGLGSRLYGKIGGSWTVIA